MVCILFSLFFKSPFAPRGGILTLCLLCFARLQDPSMLELDEFVELQRISEETSWIVLLNKNVDLPAQISWQTVKTTDTAVNKLLETSGIQETTRHFNCADAVGDLKKLCDALITEIVGLDDFQEELNKRVVRE